MSRFVGLGLLTAVVALAVYRTRRLYLALAAVLAANLLVALSDSYAFLLGAPSVAELTARTRLRYLLSPLVGYALWLTPPLLLVLWHMRRRGGLTPRETG